MIQLLTTLIVNRKRYICSNWKAPVASLIIYSHLRYGNFRACIRSCDYLGIQQEMLQWLQFGLLRKADTSEHQFSLPLPRSNVPGWVIQWKRWCILDCMHINHRHFTNTVVLGHKDRKRQKIHSYLGHIFDLLHQIYSSKFLKTLLSFLSSADLQNVEPDSFAQGTTLTNSDQIT